MFPESPLSPLSKSACILIADPNEDLHPLYEKSLAPAGIKVISVFNDVECVKQMHNQAPDVLVLHPRLPLGGGDRLLQRMWKTPRFFAIPVMVLTAETTSAANPQAVKPRAHLRQTQLTKPDQLLATLRSLLPHTRLRFSENEQSIRLDDSIFRRTNGRVQDLKVEIIDKRIIVFGRCSSHYIKQLVLAAVQEECESKESESYRIELRLEVG